MLTQKRLREVLHYDPETGSFTFARGARKGRAAGTAHDARGFLKVSIDNERHLLHRLAWLWMTGTLPRWNIAHVNGDRSDNRWSNLREGDRSQKRAHRPLLAEPAGQPGVWRVGDHFDAMVEVEGQRVNIGSFAKAQEAARVAKITVEKARRRAAALGR
ncbi:MAG TPA: HNH endonuclease signature motif containing protein [Hyphomonas sp.]|mgnify:CR=1 FL=1|nr:HNH endonuclease signature motif containing protein [Hyphomonas sp.]